MLHVLVADDEKNIRDGLKLLLDWEALGFSVDYEAASGDETLNIILDKKPDLVLLDIRMPGMIGIDVIKNSRERGFKGRFIIISGYSDFTYAKEAIRFGVENYITKPIDEDELEAAVIKIKDDVNAKNLEKTNLEDFKKKAKSTILLDLLHGIIPSVPMEELALTNSIYQVVIYENFSTKVNPQDYSFADLMRVTNQDNTSYEILSEDSLDIIILKGEFSISRFKDILNHYENEPPEKGSPLDGVFLAYGRIVTSPAELQLSFDDVRSLIKRRFFCREEQHTLGFEELPGRQVFNEEVSPERMRAFSQDFAGYLKAFNRRKTTETLMELENYLFNLRSDIKEIKIMLADMYLQIKENINSHYSSLSIPFPSNADIFTFIDSKNYLYEIITFLSEQFEMIMSAAGGSTRDSLFDDIIYYIDHNYRENLRLETISPLFGYNSAYLGKLFSKNVGENFNSYLDKVRITKSKELLEYSTMKVYEIAESVGYKNVDYFHKKFKKYEGVSPAEYRIKYEKQSEI